MNLLSWQMLLFLIPIAFGTVLVLGAACFDLGGGGADGDPDHDNGVAPGARVPLTLRLMYGSLCFGGLGLSAWYALGGEVDAGGVARALVAAGAAVIGTLAIGRWLERTFAHRLPLLESETIDRRDLIGATGRAVLAIGPTRGLAQVHDRRGNLHQVVCRTWEGETVYPGEEVLLVEYEADVDVDVGFYRITASPVDRKTSSSTATTSALPSRRP